MAKSIGNYQGKPASQVLFYAGEPPALPGGIEGVSSYSDCISAIVFKMKIMPGIGFH